MNKLKRKLTLLGLLLLPWALQSQDLQDYTFRTGVDRTAWIPLDRTSSSVYDLGFNSASAVSDRLDMLGFTFTYEGERFSTFSVNAKGALRLGSRLTTTSQPSQLFYAAYLSNNPCVVAARSADASVFSAQGQYVCYALVGTAPHRVFVVEFRQGLVASSQADFCKYQIQLHEDSNAIQIVYDSLSATTPDAFQTGLANLYGTQALTVNTTSHIAASGTSFSAMNTAWPGRGRWYRFTPPALACPRTTTPTVSQVSQTTAQVQWFDNGQATRWQLEYADHPFTPGTGAATVVNCSTTTATLSGLQPQSQYYAYVRALCGTDDQSTFRPFSFQTLCTTVDELPYRLEFEDSADMRCLVVHTSTQAPSATYLIGRLNTFSGISGQYALWVQPANYTYFVLPSFSEPLGNLVVTFYLYKPMGNVAQVEFGVMSDPYDTSSFQSIAVKASTVSSQWELQTVVIPDSLTTGHLVFRNHNGGTIGNSTYVIDKLIVNRKSQCPPLADLTVFPSSGSAFVSWSYNYEAVDAEPDHATVYYMPADDSTAVAHISSQRTFASIENLQSDVRYKLWVTAQCGVDNEGLTDTVEFTTKPLPCLTPDFSKDLMDTTDVTGSGTAASRLAPVNSTIPYAYIQSVYTPAMVGNIGIINSLAYDFRGTTAMTQKNDVTIYLSTVDDTVMTGFVPYDSTRFVKVYHGPLNCASQGWNFFEFDTFYRYDGSSNLLVSVLDNSGIGDPAVNFAYTMRPGFVYYYNGMTPWDIHNSSSGTASTGYQANMRFVFTGCAEHDSCASPLFVLDSLSDTAAFLSWLPGYEETSWDLYFRKAESNTWVLIEENLEQQNYVLNGLTGGTKYQMRLVSRCGLRPEAYLRFTTKCGPIYRTQLPYSADLSGTPIPVCFGRLFSSAASTAQQNYVRSVSYQGRNSVLLQDINSRLQPMLVFPESEMGVDSLELTFDFWTSTAATAADLIVGVLDDPSDVTTFVPLDTITNPMYQSWYTVTVDFSRYTGSGKHIAIRSLCYGTGIGNGWLSNISLYYNSPCRPVDNAYVDHVTYHSANIVVLNEGAYNATGYRIQWGTSDDISFADHFASFTGNSFVLDSLEDETTYYYWLSTQCGNENSRPSRFSFTTKPMCGEVQELQCLPNAVNHSAVLTWTHDGEGLAVTDFTVCLLAGSDTVATATTTENYCHFTDLQDSVTYRFVVVTACGTATSLEQDGSFFASPCTQVGYGSATNSTVPFGNTQRYSYSQILYLAEELERVGDTLHGLWLLNTGARTDSVLTDVYICNTSRETLGMSTTDRVDADSLTKVCDSVLFRFAYGWNYLPFSTPFVREHNRNIVLAFDKNSANVLSTSWGSMPRDTRRWVWFFSSTEDIRPDSLPSALYFSSGDNTPIVRFDASCEEFSCFAPTLICSDQTERTLSLRWFAGLDETRWNVDYRQAGDTAWTRHLTADTSTATVIGNLQNGTLYDVRVTPICTSTDDYASLLTVGTECGRLPLPYTEDFEQRPEGLYDRLCWYSGTDDATFPAVDALGTFGKMLNLRRGAYVVLPDFEADVNQLEVSVTYWGNYLENEAYVGVIANPEAPESIEIVDTLRVHNTNCRESRVVRLDGVDSLAGHICLYVPSGLPKQGSIYVDDITVRRLSSCPVVDSIFVVSRANGSADVAWTTQGTPASGYLVEYGVHGFERGQGTTQATSTPDVTLGGLQGCTYYDVYVDAICAASGDTLGTATPFLMLSGCDGVDLPYDMDFNVDYINPEQASHALPACWSYEMLAVAPSVLSRIYVYPQIYTYESYHGTESHVLRMYYKGVVALPKFNAPLDSLYISLYHHSASSNYGLIVGVVDSVAPGFPSSFTPIDTLRNEDGAYSTLFLCGYSGSGRHIAFMNYGTATTATVYIDDIHVDRIPSCLPLTYIRKESATAHSINLQWGSSCAYSDTRFEVEYGAHGFVPGTGTRFTTAVNSTSLTELYDRHYDVYVRPICNGGDTGAWLMATLSTSYRSCDVADTLLTSPELATTSTNLFPTYSNQRYCLSEVIIDSADLAGAGFAAGHAVQGFAFYAGSTGGRSLDEANLYMRGTTRHAFDSATHYVPMSLSDLVYSGPLPATTNGWRYVNFDNPYIWDGTSSVVLAVDRGANPTGYATGVAAMGWTDTANRVLFVSHAGQPLNPAVGPTDSAEVTLSAVMPLIRLLTCPAPACLAPVVGTPETTDHSVDLSWEGDAEQYELELKQALNDPWPTPTLIAGHSASVASLLPETRYHFRLRAVCAEDNRSDYYYGTFVTDLMPCQTPEALTVATTLENVAFSWTPQGDEQHWRLHVWSNVTDEYFEADTTALVVGQLIPGMDYSVAVQALCDEEAGRTSGYSSPVDFRIDMCDTPVDVVVTTTATEATIRWTPGANNTGHWTVDYGFSGFSANEGWMVQTDTTTLTVSGLTPETTYDFYVRANCYENNASLWSAAATATTAAGVGIDEADEASLQLYPNPATESTTLRLSGVGGQVSLSVVDLHGRTVQSTTLSCDVDCSKTLDIRGLAAGTYFVHAQGEGLNLVRKLVVK